MSIELQALAGAVLILFVILVIQGAALPFSKGVAYGLGNRDEPRADSVFEARSKRTLNNHLQAMALFTPVVMIIELSQLSSGLTELGAMIFVLARAIFAAVYLIGVPFLRSAVWGVSVIGLFMTVTPIVQVLLS